MLKKLYDEIKKIIKEDYKFFIFLIIIFLVLNIKFPYYVDAPGRILNVSDRVSVEDGYDSKGSFNMTYVSERNGTILTLMIAKLNKDWDIIKKSDVVLDNETIEDTYFRDSIMLKESNVSATVVGLDKAGIDYKIKNSEIYVIYVDEDALTDIKVGDKILEVDGKKYNSREDIINYIRKKQVGETLNFKVLRDKKIKNVKATTHDEEGTSLVGVMIGEIKEINSEKEIKTNFKKNEYGPSAGLITALEIYNGLIKEDLTKGYKIAGTGTIDSNGNVGAIDGVKYKLKGAVNSKADIFLIPSGENYEEAMKIKEKNNYKIKIVSVTNFDDALNYLSQLELKK